MSFLSLGPSKRSRMASSKERKEEYLKRRDGGRISNPIPRISVCVCFCFFWFLKRKEKSIT